MEKKRKQKFQMVTLNIQILIKIEVTLMLVLLTKLLNYPLMMISSQKLLTIIVMRKRGSLQNVPKPGEALETALVLFCSYIIIPYCNVLKRAILFPTSSRKTWTKIYKYYIYPLRVFIVWI